MAERKLDRPSALGKDGLSLGIEEDRAAAAAMGFVDDFKDQQHLDNSIPLSPQWLYAKPADGKISLPHGSSLEPAEKEARTLEGTVDRKERRRNVFDADSGLRWLEEERETSLLGRRERKKDVERDVDNRKIDRRSDNVSARDNTDTRAPPAAERWNDGSTRGLGNEGRRDGKWSTRWGPDDKEKESRPDKKVDAEKDEAHAEKQTFTGRLLSESDSRDKWRPRHRQESHSVGTATYRAAPGFGSEKGRVKDSNVGFAPGRGRGNPNSVTSFNRPSSAGPIGAPAAHGKSGKIAVSFRYPRGKLLDIYRQKNVMSSFDDTNIKLEEIPCITLSTAAKPLAFVAPDTVEEALLEDIRKGKVISSEGINGSGNKKERAKELEEPACAIDDDKDKVAFAFGGLGQEGSLGLISEKDAFYVEGKLPIGASISPPKRFMEENASSSQYGITSIQEGLKTDEIKSSADHDLGTKLPDDSNTLFDVPPVEHPPEPPMPYQSSDMDIKAGGHATNPEELTLYYLDPQGGVQGPFLGADIISWYEDGYFGLELPVRLSQAPDDVPFRPLVEVMPHLGQKPQSHIPRPCDGIAESLDSSQGKFESTIPAASSVKSDQESIWDSGSNAADPKRGDHVASVPSRTGWLPSLETGKDVENTSNRQQHISESVNQDAEVLYTGRPNSSMGQSLRDLENDRVDFQLASRDPHSVVGEANLPQHDVPRESDLSPLGLLWSELEGHPKQPLSSNVLGPNEWRNPKPTAPKDVPSVNMRHGPHSRMNEASSVHDEWPANFGRHDSMNDANISGRIPQVEADHHLNYEGQLLLQQIRREQMQDQMMARNNLEFPGPFPGQVFDSLHQRRQPMNQSLPDMEHLLRVQFELEQQQQRRQQIQQEQHQRQLQQQRQAQLLQQQQQQQQQQMILEQLLQMQGSNFGQPNMVDQVLLREHVLNELHQQPHHLQRQHDAAIEQLIQAKFGHGLHREHHNDMLDVLSHSNQRQMLPLEQQILLGLQHEQQLQSQQIANALRQHSGREEERHLGGVWPMDDAAQFILSGTSPNQRHGRFDLLENLQRSSSFEHHEHLDRSLSLHERLHRGGQGIHSLERSGSLPGGGAAVPNPDVINALARHHGLGQLETHGDLYTLGQMPMLPSGVHPQQHRIQDQLSGSNIGRLERHWSDANGQLQNSLMESSRINQLQIEAEKQRRNVEMSLPVDNPHAWAALLNKERNAEQDLSDMIHKKLVLQSQQSLGFPDAPVSASFGRKDHFAQPVVENPLRSPVDRLSFEESIAERPLYAKTGQLVPEGAANLGSLSNSIENSGKFNLRSGSGSMLEQKHFLGMDDVQRDSADTAGGRASANQLVGIANELARGKKQGSSVNLAAEDTDFAEEGAGKWSDSGMSKGSSHALLKRSTNQNTATSQAVSTDLSSAIRLKKAGFASSDENKMESGVPSAVQAMEASVPSLPSATNNPDASGPSFSEALKSKKPPLQYDASESADGGPGGKGVKKKAKKGKQIDPSLLGFKVHSNRIMMGEIVRDD
ncbi:hypothetical protein BS78_03G386900 [Paspalum vaginatum]|nr:hypothetical protein BS78_03G386900 [Paspalum vaginatum]